VLRLGFDRAMLNNPIVIHLVVNHNGLASENVASGGAANDIVEALLAIIKNAQMAW
jgi:hypothetical protein